MQSNPKNFATRLGLNALTKRVWEIRGTCATTEEGVYEGLD
jgi:hypothetical protein